MNNPKGRHFIKVGLQMIGIAVLVLTDQLTKNAVVTTLPYKEPVEVIHGFLSWYYTVNTGASFSLFNEHPMILTVVITVALAAGLIYLIVPKAKNLFYDICVPLIIAGGMGNLIDRFTRGAVIDFICTDFIDFPVFNFADCLITCGAIVLCVYLIYGTVKEAKEEKRAKAASSGEADE